MDIKTLVKLTARAWSLDILAAMHNGVGGRQAPLLSATGATRAALRHSLEHLIELGALQRNPGHGHPLRPEYRLTAAGAEIAKIAGDIAGAVPDKGEFVLVRRAWTVPVLAVTTTPRRYSEIKADLGKITDRALSLALAQLHERHWLQRDLDLSDRLPRPLYRAASAGLAISRAVHLERSP